ncbi:hypothetical protein BBJ28_00025487 [Nothophytophthora sp. Chile5]|nr:hypothetical protein BBJ28_00025487 [Nothophytophthora sp. Chile5]
MTRGDSPSWFYAVAVGRSTGVFTSWGPVRDATRRCRGARFKKFPTLVEAERFLEEEEDNLTESSDGGGGDDDDDRVYAVAVGRRPGIYTDWDEALDQTFGYSGASVKRFPSYEAAEAFLDAHQWRQPEAMLFYRERTGFLANSDAQDHSGRRGRQVLMQQTGRGEVMRLTELVEADRVRQRSRKRGRNDGEEEDAETQRPRQKQRVGDDPDPKDPGTLVAFCDGSALGNGQAGCRAGFACIFPHQRDWDVEVKLDDPRPTNNRAEYLAALEALNRANFVDPDHARPMCIYSDSFILVRSITNWVHGWMKNGWRTVNGGPVKNADLTQRLLGASRGRRVIWRHVKAHTNNQDWESKWNKVADEAARKAARGD